MAQLDLTAFPGLKGAKAGAELPTFIPRGPALVALLGALRTCAQLMSSVLFPALRTCAEQGSSSWLRAVRALGAMDSLGASGASIDPPSYLKVMASIAAILCA